MGGQQQCEGQMFSEQVEVRTNPYWTLHVPHDQTGLIIQKLDTHLGHLHMRSVSVRVPGCIVQEDGSTSLHSPDHESPCGP